MTAEEKTRNAFVSWYESLPKYSGFPAKGTIAGALVVLENLKNDFDLDIESHTATGGSQIRGASGTAVKRILESHGESRTFVLEGGRTNRGLRGDIRGLLESIASTDLGRLVDKRRKKVLVTLQQFLVERVRDYHNQQRLEIVYDPAKSTWQTIQDLLDIAADVGKAGPVAQYLVGAKLQLRFPEQTISNESSSTADVQLNRHGDFHVGNTIFHVTVSPMPALYEKCSRNLRDGFRVYVLVRNIDVVGTKQNAENTASGQIAVESIETFISQNLDELAAFSIDRRTSEFRRLLEIYNRRVDAAETNKSIMIEMPRILR